MKLQKIRIKSKNVIFVNILSILTILSDLIVTVGLVIMKLRLSKKEDSTYYEEANIYRKTKK